MRKLIMTGEYFDSSLKDSCAREKVKQNLTV